MWTWHKGDFRKLNIDYLKVAPLAINRQYPVACPDFKVKVVIVVLRDAIAWHTSTQPRFDFVFQ